MVDYTKTFKKFMLEKRYFTPAEAKALEFLRYDELRGNNLMLVYNPKTEIYTVFLGWEPIQHFKKEITKKVINGFYDDTKKRIRESFDELMEEDNEALVIVKETLKELSIEVDARLADMWKQMDRSKVKKEAFLSFMFKKRLQDVFKGLAQRSDSIISSGLARLKKSVIRGEDESLKKNVNLFDIKVDNDKVKKLVNKKFEIVRPIVKQQVKNNLDAMKQMIVRKAAEGQALGLNINQIKANVREDLKGFNRDYTFERTLRTEMNKINSLAKLKKWHEMGYTEYRWHTVGDEKVRKGHKSRNRHVYKIADALTGKAPIPAISFRKESGKSINCRCQISVIKESWRKR